MTRLEFSNRMLPWTLLLALLLVAPQLLRAQKPSYRNVAIQNELPRRDTSGSIVDAHDGNLQFFAGRYYLYGTAYGKTAGFSINNRFRVYSSADLEHWTFEGELLKAPVDGVYYRPYVVYNARTKKYVLWFNWYPRLWDGMVGVATSDTPTGPFVIANQDVQLSEASNRPGDGSIFVDSDQTAYFIYTVINLGHSVIVERLSQDYLSSTGERSEVLAKGCEAPALFRHSEAYYALFDSTCCFCSKGSGARVYKAAAPLGPYILVGNINRDAVNEPIVHGQQTYVAALPAPNGTTLMWMADRWGSRADHIKGHDLQYWAPLKINEDGSIQQLSETPNWTTAIRLGSPSHPPKKPYAWPQRPDPHPLRADACTHAPLSDEEAGVVVDIDDQKP
jgi:hypothetical protein